jgi:hypothetical protein
MMQARIVLYLVIAALSAAGCGSSEPVTQSVSVSSVEATASPSSAPIDSRVSGVAREFSNRLSRNVQGTLVSITEANGNLAARWTSAKCDYTEGEVVDLLISIHREFKGSLAAIDGTRECAGQSRSYHLSGSDFQRYRTGQINDVEVLKGLR